MTVIALGKTLTRAVVSLKKHIGSLRSVSTTENPIKSLDKRTSDLESLVRSQAVHIGDLESDIKEASVVTSALAQRVISVFWIAVLSGIVALTALVLSILAIAHSW